VAEVRPIRRSDAPALRLFHEQLSDESRRQRFLTSHPHLSHRELDRLTMLDHDRREALVAIDDGTIVAVARYERASGSDADVTLVVRDDHQGRGLGSDLLRQLAALAQQRGIERFHIRTLPDNPRMWAAAHDTGYPCDESTDGAIVLVTIALGKEEDG
jgi:RimJ/RimL family protein N-acetyltransferase